MSEAGERPGRLVEIALDAWSGSAVEVRHDAVVTEEPLEIRLQSGTATQRLAVTMRTPGHDFELAAGFLHAESLIRSRDDVVGIAYCVDDAVASEQRYNVVTVTLGRDALPDLRQLERHFAVNSSCGVCGRAHVDVLRERGLAPLDDDLRVSVQSIYALPARMRAAQRLFASTGGLHAAALFDDCGAVTSVREDVGRHNAVDKLVGWALLEAKLPLARTMLLVSGRTSYEIVQKAIVARIPVLAAVSAPSSLAVELARAFNVTLLGFVRGDRANVYSGGHRIVGR